MCKVRIGKMIITANIQKNLIPQKKLDYFALNPNRSLEICKPAFLMTVIRKSSSYIAV